MVAGFTSEQRPASDRYTRPALSEYPGVVQVRMVLLSALLAVVRKFIVLEVPDVQPLTLIGLALTTLRTRCFQCRDECDGLHLSRPLHRQWRASSAMPACY